MSQSLLEMLYKLFNMLFRPEVISNPQRNQMEFHHTVSLLVILKIRLNLFEKVIQNEEILTCYVEIHDFIVEIQGFVYHSAC